MKSCLRCQVAIPDTPANRTRKRCDPCAHEHHLEQSAQRRSDVRKQEVWGQVFSCRLCKQDFKQEQRPGRPARYCPECQLIRNYGKKSV